MNLSKSTVTYLVSKVKIKYPYPHKKWRTVTRNMHESEDKTKRQIGRRQSMWYHFGHKLQKLMVCVISWWHVEKAREEGPTSRIQVQWCKTESITCCISTVADSLMHWSDPTKIVITIYGFEWSYTLFFLLKPTLKPIGQTYPYIFVVQKKKILTYSSVIFF